MMLKCMIVDDEAGAQHILEEYIHRLNYAALVAKFPNAIDAFHFIKHTKVDLILLDINLPQVNGFGLLDMLERRPMVIFTTAYSDHALKGFEYNAIDYLHKPIRFERFVTAMEKAQKWQRMHKKDAAHENIELKIDGRTVLVNVGDVCYVESRGNYIKIYMRLNEEYMVLMTMNELEEKLPRDIFIRVHKSYIINALKILETKDDQVLIANSLLPVGKTYKKYFMEFMKLLH